MPGRVVRVAWRNAEVDAFVADPIAGLEPDLSVRTVRRTEQAAAAVVRMGDRSAGPLETVARLLLRAEGLASSAIEGLTADLTAVAVAEAAAVAGAGDGAGGVGLDTAGWVADNLAVVDDALAHDGPLDVDTIHRWHRRLMRHSDLRPDLHGAWRDAVGWIGGASPLVAAFVPAPPEEIPRLMDDLLAFVARDDVDVVTKAAVAHAQFETIHPFGDGNGRIGRVVVGWILVRDLGVPVPPAVSLAFARDIGGYLSRLTLYRQSVLDPWVLWFATAVEDAASSSVAILDAVDALLGDWRSRIAHLRADAAAHRLVELLVEHPVVSARTVADLCGVSNAAAREALAELARRGILHEASIRLPAAVGRPPRWWTATDLLALLRR